MSEFPSAGRTVEQIRAQRKEVLARKDLQHLTEPDRLDALAYETDCKADVLDARLKTGRIQHPALTRIAVKTLRKKARLYRADAETLRFTP